MAGLAEQLLEHRSPLERYSSAFAHILESDKLNPLWRQVIYGRNITGPTLEPSIDQLLSLWWTQNIPWQNFANSLNANAVKWGRNREPTNAPESSWDALIEQARPIWTPEQYRRWYRQGRIDFGHFVDAMARHGFPAKLDELPDHNDNDPNFKLFANEYETWSKGEAIDLWKKGVFDWEELQYYLGVDGIRRGRELLAVAEMWEAPTVEESHRLANRLNLTPEQYDLFLQRRGFGNDQVREQLKKLRFEVPGPSDLVRFAVRHVFEPDLIAKFRFNDERNPILDFYHQTAGINYPIFSGPLRETISKLYDEDVDVRRAATDLAERLGIEPPRGGALVPDWLDSIYLSFGLPKPTWAMAYWWSHWVWPSPTQGYMMLQRLRPGRYTYDDGTGPKPIQFTKQDLNLLLRGNDYPPYFRPFLETISYNVIPSIQLQRLRAHDRIDEDELIERFRDAGYNEKDAPLMAQVRTDAVNLTRLKASWSGLRANAIAAYKTGTIGVTDAAKALYLTSRQSMGQIEDYANASDFDKGNIAWSDPYVRMLIGSIDLQVEQTIAKQSITAVRKAYLRWEINQDGARNALGQIGIQATRIEQHLRQWEFQRLGQGKTLAASQILRYVVKGALAPQIAIGRLQLLGYSFEDAILMVQVAQQDLAMAQAKAAAAAAKSADAAARAQAQVVREAERLLREARSELARHGTPKQLSEWYVAELISYEEMQSRFDALDWPLEDRQRLIAKAEGAAKQRVFDETDQAAIEQGQPVPGF